MFTVQQKIKDPIKTITLRHSKLHEKITNCDFLKMIEKEIKCSFLWLEN